VLHTHVAYVTHVLPSVVDQVCRHVYRSCTTLRVANCYHWQINISGDKTLKGYSDPADRQYVIEFFRAGTLGGKSCISYRSERWNRSESGRIPC